MDFELPRLDVVLHATPQCEAEESRTAAAAHQLLSKHVLQSSTDGTNLESLAGLAGWLYHRSTSQADEAVQALLSLGVPLGLVAYGERLPPTQELLPLAAALQAAVLVECLEHGAVARGAQIANDVYCCAIQVGAMDTGTEYLVYALDTFQRLRTRRPEVFNPHYTMALTNYASVLSARGAMDEARIAISDALALRARLVQRDETKFGRQLAESLIVACVVAQKGGHDGMRMHFSSIALAILVVFRPRMPAYYDRLIRQLRPYCSGVDADSVIDTWRVGGVSGLASQLVNLLTDINWKDGDPWQV